MKDEKSRNLSKSSYVRSFCVDSVKLELVIILRFLVLRNLIRSRILICG